MGETTLKEIDPMLATVGKPRDGGCVWVHFGSAPTVPTDATTKMSTLGGWESVGEISDAGFTLAKSVTSNEFKSWHGGAFLKSISEESHTFKIEFVEVNRPAAAKLRYGMKNVESGADGSVSHIKSALTEFQTVPLTIDELESNGYLRRTVFHKICVDNFDEEPHQRGSLIVYGFTFTALDPGTGVFFDIYRAKPVAA